MAMKKKWILFLFVLLAVLPVVLGGTLDNVWNKILDFGRLDFLGISDGSLVTAFTRILIGIMLFTIFFASLSTFVGGRIGMNRGQSGVVAAILAIISAIFMPANVLLAVGAGWATAISLILVGGPVLGIGYVLWNLDKWLELESDTRGSVMFKLALCLILFWILSAMKYHVGKLS
tara:strand:- start:1672 stop:2196 length:525 start_codon:yes stop_codon:yes gene_type:complete